MGERNMTLIVLYLFASLFILVILLISFKKKDRRVLSEKIKEVKKLELENRELKDALAKIGNIDIERRQTALFNSIEQMAKATDKFII